MSDFALTMISPKGKVLEERVTSVVAPGYEGLFGVLAGHRHMVAQLKAGNVKVEGAGRQRLFAIDSGILEVAEDGVLILAEGVDERS